MAQCAKFDFNDIENNLENYDGRFALLNVKDNLNYENYIKDYSIFSVSNWSDFGKIDLFSNHLNELIFIQTSYISPHFYSDKIKKEGIGFESFHIGGKVGIDIPYEDLEKIICKTSKEGDCFSGIVNYNPKKGNILSLKNDSSLMEFPFFDIDSLLMRFN